MSNPKDKAKELVYKFDDTMEFSTPQRFAKECALICVDEIISIGWNLPHYDNNTGVKFWNEVKNQIISL